MHDSNSTTLATTPAPVRPSAEEPFKVRVIVIGPNGGGVRKTKTALLCGSIARAAGYIVIYVCADPGIGSLSASLKVGGPNRVHLFPEEETADYAQVLLTAAKTHDARMVIIDLGANAMLNTAYRRTLRDALADLKAAGHETFVLVSLVPGKVGLEEDAAQFASKMEKVATVVAIVHGRDNGGNFAQFKDLMQDYDSADVPNDQSAILNLITEAGVTPFDWCSAPVPGFAQAAAWMASNLQKLATQPAMIKIIGTDAAVPVLANLSRGRPTRSYTGRNARWQVRDEALTADAAVIVADEALRGVGLDAADTDVLRLARGYIAAATHRDAAYRAAKRKVS